MGILGGSLLCLPLHQRLINREGDTPRCHHPSSETGCSVIELGCSWLSQQNRTPESSPDLVEGTEELLGNKRKISLELQRTVVSDKGSTDSLHKCAMHLQVKVQASL